jgi:uncharacterized protein with GYD domain
MGVYCLNIQYAPEAIGPIIKSGSNRQDVARKAVESVGGKLPGFYGILGDPDGFHTMIIAETPNNTEYPAISIAEKVRSSAAVAAADSWAAK